MADPDLVGVQYLFYFKDLHRIKLLQLRSQLYMNYLHKHQNNFIKYCLGGKIRFSIYMQTLIIIKSSFVNVFYVLFSLKNRRFISKKVRCHFRIFCKYIIEFT